MGFTSIWHWIIVLAVVLILFARPGKISGIMGDFGKGLRNFKDGMKPGEEDKSDDDADEAQPVIEAEATVKPKAPAKKAAKKASKAKAKAKKTAKKKTAAKKKAAKTK